jgi:hypothetical protein
MQGVTDSSDLETLRRVVASWLHPARVDMTTLPRHAVYEGYAFAQRAYEFRILDGTELVFDMIPTAAVVNPVFILNNWPGESVRIGWGSRHVDQSSIQTQREEEDLVVWVEGEVTYPLRITISAA